MVNVVPLVADGSDRAEACVWVRTGLGSSDHRRGPVVGAPRRAAPQAALAGDALRGRWLRSWSSVWEWPWR